MQLEREVTMEEIANTPAVPLSPIQGEEIDNALPEMKSGSGAQAYTSNGDPINDFDNAPAPQAPAQPVQQTAAPQPQAPVRQAPQQPQQRPQRQWSSNPNEFNPQSQAPAQPVQQAAAPQPQAPQQQAPQQPQQGGWQCECGATNTGKFCSNCGKPKPEAPKGRFCTNCGAQLAEGAKFCPECGTKQ